jgi:hypothetical protein
MLSADWYDIELRELLIAKRGTCKSNLLLQEPPDNSNKKIEFKLLFTTRIWAVVLLVVEASGNDGLT